jgi:ribosomal protein S19E (S16A)
MLDTLDVVKEAEQTASHTQYGSTDQRGSHPEHRNESGHAERQILPGDWQVNLSRT